MIIMVDFCLYPLRTIPVMGHSMWLVDVYKEGTRSDLVSVVVARLCCCPSVFALCCYLVLVFRHFARAECGATLSSTSMCVHFTKNTNKQFKKILLNYVVANIFFFNVQPAK